MKVSHGIHYWLEYHKLHSKKSTLKTYQSILSKLTVQFGERDLISPTPEEVLSFLTNINQVNSQENFLRRFYPPIQNPGQQCLS